MLHYWHTCKGFFTFPDLYAWIAQQVPLVGARLVEVGSNEGQSAACLGVELVNRGCTEARIDLVDGGDFAAAYEKNLSPIKSVIGTFHRELSWDAARHYADGSLDFVFIDASHRYEDVRADIAAWRSKVKPGAWLAGHDYCPFFPGVLQAVTEAFERVDVWRGFQSRLGEPPDFPEQYWPCWAVKMDGKGAEGW